MKQILILLFVFFGSGRVWADTSKPGEKHDPDHKEHADPPEKGEKAEKPGESGSPEARELKQLNFVYTSDLYGRFFTPDCTGKNPRSYLLSMVEQVDRIRQQLDQEGKPLAMIGGGNLFSPDAMGLYLLENLSGAVFVASNYKKMGMVVNAWGPQDFLATDGVLEMASRMFFRQEIPLLATNIECEKGKEKACAERIRTHHIFEMDGVKIGIVALFPENHTARLPKASRELFKFTAPAKAYKESHEKLVKEGVHLIFLVSHLDTEITYPAQVLSFLRGLDVPEPHVVFASQSQSPNVVKLGFISLIKRNHGSLIVGSSRFGRSITRLRLALAPKEGGGFDVNASESEAMDVPVTVENLTEADPGTLYVSKFCEAFNVPLGKNIIDGSMDLDSFLGYILGIMRASERAELAVINRDILMQYDFPVTGTVTREMIARLIRSDSGIVTLHLKGKDIKGLLGAYADKKDGALKVLGLEAKKGGGFTINQRDIEDELHYKVVSTQYVMSGGGGILTPRTDFSTLEKGVRQLVIGFFQNRNEESRKLDFASDFPDLWKNYVWNGGGNVGITFGHSSIYQSGLYEDKPKLMGRDLTSVNVDITFFTGISNVNHALSMRTRLLYGKTWTTIEDELGQTIDIDKETADEVRFNVLYQLKSPKNTWWKGSWWAPIPFVDVGYNTEFTASLRDETYRAKLFTGVVGMGMEVWENRLFFKAGAGLRREYGEEDVKAQRTIYAGWQLNNGDLFKVFGQGVKGESRLDGFILDSDGTPKAYEIQATNKLYFALSNRIFFNFTHEAYALKRQGGNWSFAMDFLFGFNVLFDARVPFIIH